MRSPHLFRELDALPTLLERATGHTLHTPGLTPENPTPLSLRVETLAVATIELAREYHRHRMEHPIQSQIDIVLAAPRVVGGWARDAFKLINFLIKLKNPEDPIAREMGTRIDSLATTIHTYYVETIQHVDPTYDPNSASSRLGEIAWQMVPIGRTVAAGRMVQRSTTIPRRLVTSESLALQSQRALQKEAMALERLTQPALRSGVPKVPKISPHSLSHVERKMIREIETLKRTTPKAHDKIIRSVCNSKPLHEREIRNILCHQGFKPPPRPAGIPKDWVVTVSKDGGGIKYSLVVQRKTGERMAKSEVRIMPGNPESLNPAQRRAYVMHQVEGLHYDKFGNIVSRDSFEAHIPYKEYDFNKISKAINYE